LAPNPGKEDMDAMNNANIDELMGMIETKEYRRPIRRRIMAEDLIGVMIILVLYILTSA
jgi:hypothetical protein